MKKRNYRNWISLLVFLAFNCTIFQCVGPVSPVEVPSATLKFIKRTVSSIPFLDQRIQRIVATTSPSGIGISKNLLRLREELKQHSDRVTEYFKRFDQIIHNLRAHFQIDLFTAENILRVLPFYAGFPVPGGYRAILRQILDLDPNLAESKNYLQSEHSNKTIQFRPLYDFQQNVIKPRFTLSVDTPLAELFGVTLDIGYCVSIPLDTSELDRHLGDYNLIEYNIEELTYQQPGEGVPPAKSDKHRLEFAINAYRIQPNADTFKQSEPYSIRKKSTKLRVSIDRNSNLQHILRIQEIVSETTSQIKNPKELIVIFLAYLQLKQNQLPTPQYSGLLMRDFRINSTLPPYYGPITPRRLLSLYYTEVVYEGLINYESILTNISSTFTNIDSTCRSIPVLYWNLLKAISYPFNPVFQTYFKLMINMDVANRNNLKYLAFLTPQLILKPLIRLNESHPVLKRLSLVNPTNSEYPTVTQPTTSGQSAKQQILRTVMVSLPGYIPPDGILSCLNTLLLKQQDKDSSLIQTAIRKLKTIALGSDYQSFLDTSVLQLDLFNIDYRTVGLANNPVYSYFAEYLGVDNVHGGSRTYKTPVEGQTLTRLTHLLSDEMHPNTEMPLQMCSLKGSSSQQNTVLLLYGVDEKHKSGMVYLLPSNLHGYRQIGTTLQEQRAIFSSRPTSIKPDFIAQVRLAYNQARARLYQQLGRFYERNPHIPEYTKAVAKQSLCFNTPVFGYSTYREGAEPVQEEKVYKTIYPLPLTVRLPFYNEPTDIDFVNQLQRNLQIHLKKWIINFIHSLDGTEDTIKTILQQFKTSLPPLYNTITQEMEDNNKTALQKLKTLSGSLQKHLEPILHYDLSTKANLPSKLRTNVEDFEILFDKVYQELGLKDTVATAQLQFIKNAEYEKTVPAKWDYPKWFGYRHKFELVLLDYYLKKAWRSFKNLRDDLNLDKNVLELMLQLEKQDEPSLATLQLASRVAPSGNTKIDVTTVCERVSLGAQLKQTLKLNLTSYRTPMYPLEAVYEQMYMQKIEQLKKLETELNSSVTYFQKAFINQLIEQTGLNDNPCLTTVTIKYNFLKQFKKRMDAVYRLQLPMLPYLPYYTNAGLRFSSTISDLKEQLDTLDNIEQQLKSAAMVYTHQRAIQIEPSFINKLSELGEKQNELRVNVEAMKEILKQGQRLKIMEDIAKPLKEIVYYNTDLSEEDYINSRLINILRILKETVDPIRDKFGELTLRNMDQIRTLQKQLEKAITPHLNEIHQLKQLEQTVRTNYRAVFQNYKKLEIFVKTVDNIIDRELDPNPIYAPLKRIRIPYPNLRQQEDIEANIANYNGVMKQIRRAIVSRLYIMQSYQKLVSILHLPQVIWGMPYSVDQLRGELELSNGVKTFITQFNNSVKQLSQRCEWKIPVEELFTRPYVDYPTVKQSILLPVYYFQFHGLSEQETPVNKLFTQILKDLSSLEKDRPRALEAIEGIKLNLYRVAQEYNQYIAPSFNAQVLLNYLKQVYEDEPPSTKEIGLVYRSLKNIVCIDPDNSSKDAQYVGQLDLGTIPKSSNYPFDTDLTFKNIYKEEDRPVVINAQLLPYGPAYTDSGQISPDQQKVKVNALITRAWSVIMKTLGIQGFKAEAYYGSKFQTPLTQIYPELVQELEYKVNELDPIDIKRYTDSLDEGVTPVQEMYESFFNFIRGKTQLNNPEKQESINKNIGLITDATRLRYDEFKVENKPETTDKFKPGFINPLQIPQIKPLPEVKSFAKVDLPVGELSSELEDIEHTLEEAQTIIEHIETFQREGCIDYLQKRKVEEEYKQIMYQKLFANYYKFVGTPMGTAWDSCLRRYTMEPLKNRIRLRVTSQAELMEFERQYTREWNRWNIRNKQFKSRIQFYKVCLASYFVIDELYGFEESVETSKVPKNLKTDLKDCLHAELQDFATIPDERLYRKVMSQYEIGMPHDSPQAQAKMKVIAKDLIEDLKMAQDEVVSEVQSKHKATLFRELDIILNNLRRV